MTKIEKLIELWNARPQRVEPDNEEHLLYIFTGLLPALRDAMPKIVELTEQPAAATDSPSTDLPPAPVPGPSSHTQGRNLNMAGIVEGSGPAADNVGIPASSPARVAEAAVGVSTKQPEAARRAKSVKARKPAAVLRGQPQETVENETA